MKRKIILVAMDFFDNGDNDPFIMPEIPYLLEHFDVTVISVRHKRLNSMQLPSIYRLVSLPPITFLGKAFGVLSTIWTPLVRSEIAKIWASRKYSLRLHLMCAHLVARGNALQRLLQSEMATTHDEGPLLYAYWLLPSILLPMARIQASNRRVEIVARVHSSEVYAYMHSPQYIPYLDIISQIPRKLYFVSENARNHFSENYPSTGVELAVSRLGVSQVHSCSNRGSDDGVFRIVSCSELKPNKNVDKIIEALALIETALRIEWTHFGGGQLQGQIHELARRKLASKPNVMYRLAGRVPNNLVLEHYANSPVDLFVNVSTAEGIPVAIMEAIANSIPVLATDVGGTNEIVNGENGELLDKGVEVNCLKARIESFASLEVNEMAKKRAAAHKTWSELYNAETNQSRFVQDLHETVTAQAGL